MKSEKEEWMKIFYEECWRQYDHEDNLFEKRNTLFITIQAIFIGVLGASPFIGNKDIFACDGATFIYSIASILLSLLSYALLINWKKVAKSGNKYVNLRFENAQAIEEELKKNNLEFNSLNLAKYEDDYRNTEEFKKGKYVGGYKVTKNIINILFVFWGVVLCGAVVLLFYCPIH